MTITVLTDRGGEIIGTVRPGLQQEGIFVRIVPGPNQKLHELSVPDDLGDLRGTELHERLRAHLKKAKARS